MLFFKNGLGSDILDECFEVFLYLFQALLLFLSKPLLLHYPLGLLMNQPVTYLIDTFATVVRIAQNKKIFGYLYFFLRLRQLTSRLLHNNFDRFFMLFCLKERMNHRDGTVFMRMVYVRTPP